MISIIILTKNERHDLPGCLAALKACDDIHVVDSGSTDGTQAYAKEAGATVWEHAFESFAAQRNWALDHCSLRHPWVLFLDADEWATPMFLDAVKSVAKRDGGQLAGAFCCWKLMLQGKWLRRSDSFPKWQFRLLRVGQARFVDFGHGQKETDLRGEVAYVHEPYLHFAFSKGWSHWWEKHNRYSDLEAKVRLQEKPVWSDVLSRHGSRRNKALKLGLTRIPGWPLLRFLWPYFCKLGFLEGRAGITYCVNMAYYEFLIKVKMDELRQLPRLDSR